jgi:hydrogenase maturation factor
MKAGKLSESVLKRSVLKQLHTTGEAQLVRPGVGVDYGAIRTGTGEAVITATETRCLGNGSMGAAGVYAALNNLVCSGARPLGVTVSLLLPTALTEQDLRDRVGAIDRVCEAEQLPVLGGHTEVVRSVTEPVLTVTAVGVVQQDALVGNTGARPGMDILVTKWIGLEGTAILAEQQEEALRTRYAQPFVDQAKQFAGFLSVRTEAAAAAQSGVAAMHDLSEGGVFGALWELGQCAGIGLDIDLKKIPIRQETVEICEFFDLNPYKLLSGGSLLLAADDGNALVRAIAEAGGKATIIGKATGGNDRVLRNGEEFRFLETTQTDELWKLKK